MPTPKGNFPERSYIFITETMGMQGKSAVIYFFLDADLLYRYKLSNTVSFKVSFFSAIKANLW